MKEGRHGERRVERDLNRPPGEEQKRCTLAERGRVSNGMPSQRGQLVGRTAYMKSRVSLEKAQATCIWLTLWGRTGEEDASWECWALHKPQDKTSRAAGRATEGDFAGWLRAGEAVEQHDSEPDGKKNRRQGGGRGRGRGSREGRSC